MFSIIKRAENIKYLLPPDLSIFIRWFMHDFNKKAGSDEGFEIHMQHKYNCIWLIS